MVRHNRSVRNLADFATIDCIIAPDSGDTDNGCHWSSKTHSWGSEWEEMTFYEISNNSYNCNGISTSQYGMLEKMSKVFSEMCKTVIQYFIGYNVVNINNYMTPYYM